MKRILIPVLSATLLLTACNEVLEKTKKKTEDKLQTEKKTTAPSVKSVKDFPLNFKVKSLSQNQLGPFTTFHVDYEYTEPFAAFLAKEKPVLSFRLELPKSLYTVIGTNTKDQPLVIPTKQNGKLTADGTILFKFQSQGKPDLTKKYITNDAIKLHVLNENQREFFTIADLGSNAASYKVNAK